MISNGPGEARLFRGSWEPSAGRLAHWRCSVTNPERLVSEKPTVPHGLVDEDIVARVCAGEVQLFELLMRRHNPRVFRVVRSIVHRDDEAEDVMQDAYVRAYDHL